MDPSLPQTLQIAVWLLYINAVFGVIFGQSQFFFYGPIAGIAGLAAYLFGGLGIANGQKWGYTVAIAVAAVAVVILLLHFSGGALISLLFDGALLALLVHPQSRSYQRIWFS